MKCSVFTGSPLKQKSDCLVLGLCAGNDGSSQLVADVSASCGIPISELVERGDLSEEVGKTAWLYPLQGPFQRILCCGFGNSDKLDAKSYRKASAALAGRLAESPSDQAVVSVPGLEERVYPGQALETLLRAIDAACYRFNALKPNTAKPAAKLAKIRFHAPGMKKSEAEDLLNQAEALCRGIAYTRDLANLPGNHCTPRFLARQARKLAKDYDSLSVDVLGEKKMKELGMGSFLSVSAGSDEEGQLIIMQYQGGRKGSAPYVLVGKGITFDTGGISLKPGAAMDEMKYDMGGAASVFGTLLAICEMNAPINVVGVIAAAENMPSGGATKPGDVVTSLSGQTIEILNTDAEGRLVLCDALTYTERFEPAEVVDIATLTGACIVALGHECSGVMGNDQSLVDQLLACGEQSGDRCWQLPLWEEYDTQLESNFADMQNIGGKGAGSITAGCFLKKFAGKFKWAHLDIAGTAWISGKEKGATGRPVPLLTHYLLSRIE